MSNLKDYLKIMVDRKASDVHLTVGLPPQLRVDGKLTFIEESPVDSKAMQEITYSVLNDSQIQKFEEINELDCSFGVEGVGRFRLNLYRQRGSVACAIRFIPFEIPGFKELGLPEIVKEFATRPNGLVLISGPTGSGKSTTQAAMIDYINDNYSYHVITIEDPIEYLHKHKKSTINQRELGSDTYSFPEALKRVFRQDPDVILIGEMRDLDTMTAALNLSETGHLVLATLHTSDAAHSIARIVDFFPDQMRQSIVAQLSMVLSGIIVQQLIPRKDGQGRALAIEIMNVIPSIRTLIREKNLHQIYSTIQTGSKYSMVTMTQSLVKLVHDNVIDYEEAKKRANDVAELEELLSRYNPGGMA